jgi:MFS family permease
MLTIIFAAYVLSLLMALLLTGSLSDYVGRRPVILTAPAMNMVAMIMIDSSLRSISMEDACIGARA